MSQSQAAAPTAMPLFYKRVVAISAERQGQLRLDRSAGYAFAAGAQSVPLGLTEIESAAQHYPVLFTSGATPAVVALLGLREGQNLFVRPDGSWLPDAYVPAYVRGYPFIAVEDAASRTQVVAVEPDAPHLRPDAGALLFEDGRPSPALSEATAFAKALRESMVAAGNFARLLNEASVLEEEEATVNFTAGGSTRIRGFKIVKQERLAEVDDATYLDWRRMGWVAAIYAHVFSIGRWGRLIEMAARTGN